jgi:hypothetical protein
MQQATYNSTFKTHKPPTPYSCAPAIKQEILEKRQLRKRWQNSRSPQDKAKLNKAATELKQLLLDHKQQTIQVYRIYSRNLRTFFLVWSLKYRGT